MTSALAGKRALVTGSTQGLGLAIARRLASAGCHVVITGLATREEAAPAVEHVAGTAGAGRVIYLGADFRDAQQIDRLVTEAAGTFGALDIVVNNAVVRHVAPVESFDAAHWDEDVAVNLSAAFHTIRLALPAMKAQNWGRIVNVSSIYGLVGAPNRIGYVTTKTALLGLTRAVALETSGFDITCNAICPGTSATPVHEASLDALVRTQGLSRTEAERRLLAGKQPTGRLIAPDGAAALVEFLCGPEARDITGAALPIDGGWAAQ